MPNRSSGIKYQFHDAVVDYLRSLADTDGLAMGDTNTGMIGVDEESGFFNQQETDWFANLQGVGWTDVWRKRNPDSREYTYHSTSVGNGFRIDQAFATRSMMPRISSVRHDWGTPACGAFRGLSDHAAVVIDLEESAVSDV